MMRACAIVCLVLLALPTNAAEPLRLVLDWALNPDHAPLIVAKERGMFSAAGLDVTLIEPADPSDPPRLIAAHQAEAGLYYQPQLHLAVDQGVPLVRIATLIAAPLNSVIVLEDGPIHSIADLAGRKIGYSVAGFDTAMLGAMLRSAGVDPTGVTTVDVNFSLVPPVLTGAVDAAIGAFRNVEPFQAEAAGQRLRVLPVEANGIPAYDELVVLAARDRLGDPRLPKLVAAIEQATLWLADHPEDGWALFVTGRSEQDTVPIHRAFEATRNRFSLDPAALDRGRYQRFAAFLKAAGQIATVPPVDSYAVELAR